MDKTIAEYTLRNVKTPIAATPDSLPGHLKANLPTIKQFEMELDEVVSKLSKENEAVEP